MFFIGAVTNPKMLYFASQASRNTAQLRVHHIKELNKDVKLFKEESSRLYVRRPCGIQVDILMFAAAIHGRHNEIYPHLGFIILHSFPDRTVHTVSFASRKGKRVARSTLAAEALAATDA